ncbi:ATP-dependent RNA helicase DDX24 [Orchesella cincta]|uniref:ATP-dependent RNA helicase n=1 Tax=Orchesella cincta TaxID=48709 RepID=A0A1D2NL67_ORCCI|nr:ATP-dependent RNA helicase DDX24 [Orchesella cincta]
MKPKAKKGSKKSGGGGAPKKTAPGANRGNQGKQKSRSKKGEWNLVPVGDEFFSDKEFENLVSFEELVDYNVVSKADGTKEILTGGETEEQEPVKGMKRKAEELEEEEEEADEQDDIEIQQKLGKKKQKKKNVGVDDASEVINTSAGLVIVEEVEADVESVESNSKPEEAKVTKTSTKNTVKESSVKKAKKKNKKNGAAVKSVEEPEKEETQENETAEENDFEEQEWMKLGVPEVILRSLKEKKFNKPTNIQTLTLPAAILGKKDVVGAAETGSGKTLAFAIPIIDGIIKRRSLAKVNNSTDDDDDEEVDGLQALILTPTRELAVQIKNHFDVAAKYANVKTVVIVGGLASQKQERLLRGRPDVVIATPGRLWELVHEGDPHLSTINQIKYLAIDETDRMVEKGHFKELQSILQVLNKEEMHKQSRQNFVFSATLAFTHEPPQRMKTIGNRRVKQQPKKVSAKVKLKQIMEMVGLRANPKIVDITTSKGTCETLTEMQINCSQDYKDYYLYYFLLCHPGRAIVFCNSINCVRRLTNIFFFLQCGEVLPLHSEMHQKQRLRNLEKFTANEKGILIATDVAARGLDIQNIQHVIHYQVPKTAESYIHRSGRTARAFKGGIAILMVEPGETTTVKNIFRSLGREEMLPIFDVDGKVFREIKSRIEMAVKVEKFEHTVRKKLADHNWMEKSKKEMELATSEEDSDEDSGKAGQKKNLMQAKKKLENYKNQLAQMLSNNTFVINNILSK